MFELSVALKYLVPRWRQLSVSIISMISILVIALVVWLIIVFFSVTYGLEKVWTQKLIALTAPVRLTPTEDYYKSYYYQIDGISSESDYTLKTIGEKLKAPASNPYNPDVDEEIPSDWLVADLNSDGSLKDPVKDAYQSIKEIQKVSGLTTSDYEMTAANVKLRLIRGNESGYTQAFVSQAAYLGSFDPRNPSLDDALLSLTAQDLHNQLEMLSISSNNILEDAPESINRLQQTSVQERLKAFFDRITVTKLRTRKEGWALPKRLLPPSATFHVAAAMRGDHIAHVTLTRDKIENTTPGTLTVKDGTLTLQLEGKKTQPLQSFVPILLNGSFPVDSVSFNHAFISDDIRFHATIPVQGYKLSGDVPYQGLEIADFKIQTAASPFWIGKEGTDLVLPSSPQLGDGVLLPKGFKDSGVLLGDLGYISYYSPTASSVQEQRIPIHVTGFYDPGIIPIGGKFLLTSKDVTTLIRASHNQEDTVLSNGINIRFDDIAQAENVKSQLQKAFDQKGISQYWKIETYREFDFTKDLLQQLKSEKNLWTLIATVIIIVACSNIISMLIILVNDKKVEIGILRSMGASSRSIAAIFGFCGMVMGLIGSVFGILVAIVTLKNLRVLIDFISKVQGYDAFNPMFYGDTLPNEVSFEALAFVLSATVLISLLAGIVPATKASMMRPSTILRSE